MSSAVLWRKLCNQQRPPATSRLGVLSWKQILQPQSSLHMTAAQANFLTVTFWDTLGQNHPAKPFRTPNTQETLWGATCLLLWLLSFRGILCSNRCNRYKVLDPPLLVWQVKKKKKKKEFSKGFSSGDFYSAPGTFKWWRKSTLLLLSPCPKQWFPT